LQCFLLVDLDKRALRSRLQQPNLEENPNKRRFLVLEDVKFWMDFQEKDFGVCFYA